MFTIKFVNIIINNTVKILSCNGVRVSSERGQDISIQTPYQTGQGLLMTTVSEAAAEDF